MMTPHPPPPPSASKPGAPRVARRVVEPPDPVVALFIAEPWSTSLMLRIFRPRAPPLIWSAPATAASAQA